MSNDPVLKPAETTASKPDRMRFVWLGLIGLVSLLYATKPDALWALAILPVWTWSGIAWLVLIVTLRRKNWKRKAVWAGLWLIPVLIFSQEWISIGRGLFSGTPAHSLRVVSLNCLGGSFESAKEVAPFKPDIMLFQESPSQLELQSFATQMFGVEGFAFAGPDCSVVAHGKNPVHYELSVPGRPVSNATAVLLELSSGQKLLAVSLRLQPPLFDLSFFSPECWTAYAENRRLRRQELADLRRTIDSLKLPEDVLVIFGGDFNTPPDPSVQNVLRPWLEDSFDKAGVGWGNTAVNQYPLVRIDQVWHSKELTPVSVRTKATENSDHRMVIADFQFKSI